MAATGTANATLRRIAISRLLPVLTYWPSSELLRMASDGRYCEILAQSAAKSGQAAAEIPSFLNPLPPIQPVRGGVSPCRRELSLPTDVRLTSQADGGERWRC